MSKQMRQQIVSGVLGALMLAFASFSDAQDYVRTIAAAPEHTLYFPQFLAVDEANDSNVVISNYTVGSFDVYMSTGTFVRSITGAFNSPTGVAIDTANDNNIVGIAAGTAVLVFKSDGTLVTSFIPSGPNALEVGYGVAIDTGNGSNILVADTGGHNRVEVFTSTGTFVREIAGTGANALSDPRDVAVDLANGSNVLVADADNNRIQVFTSNGDYVRTIAGSGASALFSPTSVDVDAAHNSNVVVTDNSNRVFVFTSTGSFVRIIDPPTGAGGDDTALHGTNGVAVDTANQSNILVADSFNNRIQVYSNLAAPPPPPVPVSVPLSRLWLLFSIALLLAAAGYRTMRKGRL
ncbi:MAG: NHL repeat-containing protein [Casimicrobiaceae bacterium]